MVEITNADQLEAWLKDRPREDAVLIAARCALRVFPLLAPLIEDNAEERRATLVLPTCRASLTSTVAGSLPLKSREVRSAAFDAADVATDAVDVSTVRTINASFVAAEAANAAATQSLNSSPAANFSASAAFNAVAAFSAYADTLRAGLDVARDRAQSAVSDATRAADFADTAEARAASLSVDAIDVSDADAALGEAAFARSEADAAKELAVAANDRLTRAMLAVNALASVLATFWNAVDIDAKALAGGSSHDEFNEFPLWHSGTPHIILELWGALRDELLSADEGWEVWTIWYQNRLDGKPANEELEVAKALIPDEIWQAGPATLNAEIARLIAEHESAGEATARQRTPAVSSTKPEGHSSVVSARPAILAQSADLHDRIAQEIALQRDRRSNDPIALENIEFLESLQIQLADLNDAVNELTADPQPADSEPATDRAWNLRDKIEEYAGWIAGEEHALQIANGTLIGGMVTLLISLGWAPLPLTATAIAMIGGPKLKAHLSDLIKQLKGG